MNGVHDMGGMHGFGSVDVGDDAIFHEDWEKYACALVELTVGGGYFNIDTFRANIESMDPADYLAATYFERWLHSVETALIDRGYLTRSELESRLRDIEAGSYAPIAAPTRHLPPESKTAADSSAVVQRFRVGERVRVRNVHVATHTRSPRYLRGKVGVINRCHGHEVLPDTNAHDQDDVPQVVYSVTFEGSEIWGESSDPALRISIDLWDSYLEPA